MSGMLEIRKIPSGTTRINSEVSGRWMQPREATRTQSRDQREAIQHTAGITTRFKNRLAQLATKREGVRREFGDTDAASQNYTSGTCHKLIRGIKAEGCNRARQHAHRAEINARSTNRPQTSLPINVKTSYRTHHSLHYFSVIEP